MLLVTSSGQGHNLLVSGREKKRNGIWPNARKGLQKPLNHTLGHNKLKTLSKRSGMRYIRNMKKYNAWGQFKQCHWPMKFNDIGLDISNMNVPFIGFLDRLLLFPNTFARFVRLPSSGIYKPRSLQIAYLDLWPWVLTFDKLNLPEVNMGFPLLFYSRSLTRRGESHPALVIRLTIGPGRVKIKSEQVNNLAKDNQPLYQSVV